MKLHTARVFYGAILVLCVVVGKARSADVDDLSASVARLPDGNASEQVKKCLLGVDVDFARSAISAGDEQYADTLLGEVRTAISGSPDQMGRIATDVKQISALAPVADATDNPYIAQIAAGAQQFLAAEDEPLGKSSETVDAVDPDPQHMQSRDVARRMRALMWLYFNPASPMRGDVRILQRLFRRQLAYADALDLHAGKLAAGKSILDDFAIAPAACALREFTTLLPGALLPSQKAQLDRAMRKAADKMDGKARAMMTIYIHVYANIDLALSFELLNFGLYLHDQSLLDRSASLLTGVEQCIFPAGGVAYLGAQNECPNYQDTISSFLADLQLLTGDPRCLDWLKRMQWYGPVSLGPMAEFWTAPSWKHQWNMADSASAVGGEEVVSLSGNPYARGMLPLPSAQDKTDKQWDEHVIDIPFYRPGIVSKPLPDHYVALDQNIDGPRAWYGRFTYAATMRQIPVDQPGLTTIMGCMTLDDRGMFDAIMMSAGVRANLPDGKTAATLTSGMKRAMIVGSTFSICGVDYDLAVPKNATKGPVVPWRGRQVWIGLPGRVIGLLAVMPSSASAQASSVDSFVELGTGGTVTGKPEKIAKAEPGVFDYGRLRVRCLGGNMREPQTRLVPFRIPKAPITELFRSASSFPSEQPFWSVYEIADRAADQVAVAVDDVRCEAASMRFHVTAGEDSYEVAFNASGQAIAPAGLAGDGFDKGALFSSDIDGSATAGQIVAAPPASIRPGQLLAWVKGPHVALGHTAIELMTAHE